MNKPVMLPAWLTLATLCLGAFAWAEPKAIVLWMVTIFIANLTILEWWDYIARLRRARVVHAGEKGAQESVRIPPTVGGVTGSAGSIPAGHPKEKETEHV